MKVTECPRDSQDHVGSTQKDDAPSVEGFDKSVGHSSMGAPLQS